LWRQNGDKMSPENQGVFQFLKMGLFSRCHITALQLSFAQLCPPLFSLFWLTNSASSDYIQLYNGDKKTLIESLERIQKTTSEILEAVMIDKESECETAGGESRVAVAA